MLADFIYRLAPSDAPQIELVSYTRSSGVAATQISLSFNFPQDALTELTHLSWQSFPGAGQVFQSVLGEFTSGLVWAGSVNPPFYGFRRATLLGAGAFDAEFARVELMVPAGAQIGLTAFFDLGAAPNSFRAALYGRRIPRGNIRAVNA